MIFFSTFFQPLSAFQKDTLRLKPIYTGFKNATSLSVTRNHIYVVDQGRNQVVKLDHFGNERDRIGGTGSGDYQFSKPVDVDATNGLKIYISDYNNRRVQIFDRRGQYLSSLDESNNERNRRLLPTQLVVNDVGEVFLFNESDKIIEKYGFNGSKSNYYRLPREIEQVDDIIFFARSFYVLDKKAEVIHVLSENWIYESFYPAEGVNAFFVEGGNTWMITNSKIIVENGRKKKNFNWKSLENPVDAQILDDYLYILNRYHLYKVTLPK